MAQTVVKEAGRSSRASELRGLDPALKASRDRELWSGWLRRYMRRLQKEADAGADAGIRVAVMNSVNPKWEPRPSHP